MSGSESSCKSLCGENGKAHASALVNKRKIKPGLNYFQNVSPLKQNLRPGFKSYLLVESLNLTQRIVSFLNFNLEGRGLDLAAEMLTDATTYVVWLALVSPSIIVRLTLR